MLAGLVFLVLEMVMVPLFLDGSPWGPPRMIGAIVLGEDVLPPPATFAPWVSIFAHGVFGLALGMFYKRMQKA